MSLWKAIPTEKIPDAVSAAIIAAGNFLATNGLVAKVWNDKRTRPLELGFVDSSARYLSAPAEDVAVTPEQKEANAAIVREAFKKAGLL